MQVRCFYRCRRCGQEFWKDWDSEEEEEFLLGNLLLDTHICSRHNAPTITDDKMGVGDLIGWNRRIHK